MKRISGFLVVLKSPTIAAIAGNSDYCPLNARYLGIYRIPPYEFPPSSFPEEDEAMDPYVFSKDYNYEEGFIPSLGNARRLLG